MGSADSLAAAAGRLAEAAAVLPAADMHSHHLARLNVALERRIGRLHKTHASNASNASNIELNYRLLLHEIWLGRHHAWLHSWLHTRLHHTRLQYARLYHAGLHAWLHHPWLRHSWLLAHHDRLPLSNRSLVLTQ